MTNFTDIRDFLRAHCARYPELALQDVFKALYQSAFGCEHLIADPSAAADYIRAEAARSGDRISELVELLRRRLLPRAPRRFAGRLAAAGRTFARLFALSARHEECGARKASKRCSPPCRQWPTRASCRFLRRRRRRKLLRGGARTAFRRCTSFRDISAELRACVPRPAARLRPRAAAVCAHRPPDGGKKPRARRRRGRTAPAAGRRLGELAAKCLRLPCLPHGRLFLPARAAHGGALRAARRQRRPRALFGGGAGIPLREGRPVDYRRFDCATFTIAPPQRIEAGTLDVAGGRVFHAPRPCAVLRSIRFPVDFGRKTARAHPQTECARRHAKQFFDRWIPPRAALFRRARCAGTAAFSSFRRTIK